MPASLCMISAALVFYSVFDFFGRMFFMCGIIGCFDIRECRDFIVDEVKAGMDVMRRRGPDDEGMYAADGVVFGHRRLAVIDPVAAKQPWVDDASGVVLTYNGEFYNFREIRRELESRGHLFSTRSDTEVLVKSYLEWGKACVEHFNGMFGFAIYDPRSEEVFAARDRLGIKPFHYSIVDGVFYFASSLKAILCFEKVEPVADPAVISHYLTTIRATMGSSTMIRNVFCLLPGQRMIVRRGSDSPILEKYWDIPVFAPEEKQSIDLADATEYVGELMRDSVKKRLVSDVPLGGFLSGGIDSCIIASLAGDMTCGNYTAYSVGYDMEGYNEWPYVDEACSAYDMECRKIHLTQDDFTATWQHLVGEKGMPLSTPNEPAIFHLAEALRKEFTVALSGEGSDEIFGGYVLPYFSSYDFDRARKCPPQGDEPLTAVDEAIQRFYGRPYLLCRADHFFLLNSWIPFQLKQTLICPEVWALLNNDEQLFDHYESYFQQFSRCSTLDSYMHIHARINLEGLLSRVDSSTMACSVETRVPFTDHRLVEYAFSLPDAYKINWRDARMKALGQECNVSEIVRNNLVDSKILIREAFKNQVPKSILDRPKMSFPAPFTEWLGTSLLPFARDLIQSSPFIGTLFNRDYIENLLENARLKQASLSLWPIVNLCIWQREMNIRMS